MIVKDNNIKLLCEIAEDVINNSYPHLVIKSNPYMWDRLCPNGDYGDGYGYHESGKKITREELIQYNEILKSEKEYMFQFLSKFNGEFAKAYLHPSFIDGNDKKLYRESCVKFRHEINRLKNTREKQLSLGDNEVTEFDDAIFDYRERIAMLYALLSYDVYNEDETTERLNTLRGKDAPEDVEPDHYYFLPTYWDQRCLQLQSQILDEINEDPILNSNTPLTDKEIAIREKGYEIRRIEKEMTKRGAYKGVGYDGLATYLSNLKSEYYALQGITPEDKSVWIFADKRSAILTAIAMGFSILMLILNLSGFGK
jgi:hypothetical protein